MCVQQASKTFKTLAAIVCPPLIVTSPVQHLNLKYFVFILFLFIFFVVFLGGGGGDVS